MSPLQSIKSLKCAQLKTVSIPTEAALLPNADATWPPCCCFTFCNYTPQDHLFDPTTAIASTISNSFSKATSKLTCKRTPGDTPDPASSLDDKIVCLDFIYMETGMWEMAGAYPDSMLMGSQDAAGPSACIWQFWNTPGLQIPDIFEDISSWDYILHYLILAIFHRITEC